LTPDQNEVWEAFEKAVRRGAESAETPILSDIYQTIPYVSEQGINSALQRNKLRLPRSIGDFGLTRRYKLSGNELIRLYHECGLHFTSTQH
jgi:hypothetical protein